MEKHRVIMIIGNITLTVKTRLDEDSPKSRRVMYERLRDIEKTFDRCPELGKDEEVLSVLRELSLTLVMRRNRQSPGSAERARTSEIMDRVSEVLPTASVPPTVVREKLRGILREAVAAEARGSKGGSSSVYTLPELLQIAELSERLSSSRQARSTDESPQFPNVPNRRETVRVPKSTIHS